MRKKILIAGAAVLAVAATFLFVLKPGRADFARLRGDRDFNVILVTVDTLRADKVGCYGNPSVRTPAMDALAAGGIRFENCISQTPLTLPSHTTILTGTLPPFHGVRDNGGFVVPPELVTMAETFKARGYDTAAFVAAYVLDSKWGLDQGFDTYFDKFDLSRFERISLGEVQRPASTRSSTRPWAGSRRRRTASSSPGSTSTTRTPPTRRRNPSRASTARTPISARSPSRTARSPGSPTTSTGTGSATTSSSSWRPTTARAWGSTRRALTASSSTRKRSMCP